MGDFRSFERGDDRGGRSSGGYGGRSSGGSRGGFGGRGRDSGSRDRRDMPMCDAVCAKCGKNCQVPFKPTGDKPVYCSDCFGAQRGESRPSFGGSSAAPGITSEQFQQLNTKLDQILVILNSLEMIDEEGEDDEDDDEEEVEEKK